MSQAVLGSYHLIYRIIKYSEGNSPDHHVRRAQPVLFFRADIRILPAERKVCQGKKSLIEPNKG